MMDEHQRTHTHLLPSLYQQQGQEQLEVTTKCLMNPLTYEIKETEYEELRQCNMSENRALVAELELSRGTNQILGPQETSFGHKKNKLVHTTISEKYLWSTDHHKHKTPGGVDNFLNPTHQLRYDLN